VKNCFAFVSVAAFEAKLKKNYGSIVAETSYSVGTILTDQGRCVWFVVSNELLFFLIFFCMLQLCLK